MTKRGGITARNYVLHIQGNDGTTLCGRVVQHVNCFVINDERLDESCCLRCAAKARVHWPHRDGWHDRK